MEKKIETIGSITGYIDIGYIGIMEKKMESIGIIIAYIDIGSIGKMEKKTETTILGLGRSSVA